MSNKFLLIAIILIAAFLRLWSLSTNPPSLTSDEAALGYNAYSILKTGRDEHGDFLPILFKSFGDWKPGLYVYLTVPFVALLGLTELAVRLVGAFSGIIAVYLIYKLARILFKSEVVGIFAAFILATLPWHIHFSRGAWEISLMFTLIVGGIYYFYKGIQENNLFFYYSALFFGFTFWAYQGAKLATSLIVINLIVIYYRDIIKLPKLVVIKTVFIGLILLTPILFSLFQGKVGRLEIYSVFSYPPVEDYVNKILSQEVVEGNRESISYRLFHADTLHFVRGIFGRWLNYYSPRFYFIDGDWSNQRHSSPNVGQLLLVHLFFLISGLVALSKLRGKKEFLLVWLLLATLSLPAALSRDSIQAVRSFNLVLPLTLILALGGTFLWQQLCGFSKHLRTVICFLILILYVGNALYYFDAYFVHMPVKFSQAWGYGYKQFVEEIAAHKQQEIVVKQSYSQPYIYYLFYTKFDPASYQAQAGENFVASKFGDVGLVSKVDNVFFREINWSVEKTNRGKIFVLETIHIPFSEYNDPIKYKVLKEIRYLNSQPAFLVIETI